jgi:hypothetical protein
MTHTLKSLSTGWKGIKMSDMNEGNGVPTGELSENDSRQPDINTVAKMAESTAEAVMNEVPAQDGKKIEEIRSGFEQTEEPIDAKMGREINEEDNLRGIDQARSRADRRIEKAHKARKRNIFLVPLIALASLVGVYKASERQEAVDKAKDAEWAKTSDGIEKNKADSKMAEAVKNGDVTGGETTQYVSGDKTYEVDNTSKQ